MTKTGIIVAADGKTINDTLIYDSRTPHLLIDTRRNSSKLLDLVEMTGGTALATTYNAGPLREELFSVKHELTYVPRTSVSFYVHDAPAVTIVGHNPIGTFSSDLLALTPLGGIGAPIDYIYMTIDETYLKIMHYYAAGDALNPTLTHTSDAPLWRITMKYMINNNSRKYAYTADVYS